MKKTIHIALALVMVLGLLSGCTTAPAASAPAEAAQATVEPTAETVAEATAVPVSDWPTKAITIDVTSKAGGGTDLHTRFITNSWGKNLSQPLAVVNFDSGAIATQNALSSKADGYTLFTAHNGIAINIVTGATDFKFEDFVCIAAMQAMGGQAIIAGADAPFNNMTEMIAYAKEHPGELSCAIQTNGSTQFMWALIAKAAGGVDLKFVECAAETDKLTNVAGGFISLGNCTFGNAHQYEDAGKIKVIGVINTDGVVSPEGTPDNWKTVQEQGIDACWGSYMYIFAPAAIDDLTAEAINASLQGVATDADFVEGITNMGGIPEWHNLADSRALWQNDIDVISGIAIDLGITAQ